MFIPFESHSCCLLCTFGTCFLQKKMLAAIRLGWVLAHPVGEMPKARFCKQPFPLPVTNWVISCYFTDNIIVFQTQHSLISNYFAIFIIINGHYRAFLKKMWHFNSFKPCFLTSYCVLGVCYFKLHRSLLMVKYKRLVCLHLLQLLPESGEEKA